MDIFPEYRDDDLCADCGGKCCMVYGPSQNLTRQKLHEDERHLYGGGHYLGYGVEPLSEKIHPHACEYLGLSGCLISWEMRPPICKNFRCGLWRDLNNDRQKRTGSRHLPVVKGKVTMG